jgi:UDPglucose--hexose-1-phosphate uridylyltransferase
MAELRREPIVRRWVVITTENPKGPNDYLAFKFPFRGAESGESCPFCRGNEWMTPPETFSTGTGGGDGWAVRVVPNKSPFFHIEGDFDRRAEGMYDLMGAIGAHEIVVEAPDHHPSFATMDHLQIRHILLAYRERFIDLERDPRFQQLLILKNYPGIFNRHPHSHLLAMPVVPRGIDEEILGTLDYYQRKERCIFCDIIREELSARQRVVMETSFFLVFCPFASRFPFETWIIPKTHSPDFQAITEDMMGDLSVILQSLFARFHGLLSDPPYSLVVHTSPIQGQFHRDEYHWHVEARLRIGLREGFEWGTGFFVNPTPPENAAALLRDSG